MANPLSNLVSFFYTFCSLPLNLYAFKGRYTNLKHIWIILPFRLLQCSPHALLLFKVNAEIGLISFVCQVCHPWWSSIQLFNYCRLHPTIWWYPSPEEGWDKSYSLHHQYFDYNWIHSIYSLPNSAKLCQLYILGSFHLLWEFYPPISKDDKLTCSWVWESSQCPPNLHTVFRQHARYVLQRQTLASWFCSSHLKHIIMLPEGFSMWFVHYLCGSCNWFICWSFIFDDH